MKEKITTIILIFFINIFCWISISTLIQAFKCTKMTHTELFIHIPKSVICNWTTCK